MSGVMNLNLYSPLVAADDPMDDDQAEGQELPESSMSEEDWSAEVDDAPSSGSDVDDDVAMGLDQVGNASDVSSDSDTSVSGVSDDGVGGGSSTSSSDTDPAAAAAVPAAPRVKKPRVKGRKAMLSRSHLLYRGSRHTVLSAVYPLVLAKMEGKISTKAFGMILRVVCCILPDGNKLPSSWFKCLSVLGVKDLKDFLIDSCPCDKHSYDPLLPKLETDHCPNCLAKRFHPRVGGRGPLVPVQV